MESNLTKFWQHQLIDRGFKSRTFSDANAFGVVKDKISSMYKYQSNEESPQNVPKQKSKRNSIWDEFDQRTTSTVRTNTSKSVIELNNFGHEKN